MILALALALLPPLTAGTLLAGTLATGPGSARPSALLRLSLAWGWGIGIASCLYFVWLLVMGQPGRGYLGLDLAAFAVLAVVGAVVGWAGTAPNRAGAGEERVPRFLGVILLGVMLLALGTGLALFLTLSRQLPQGGWDAVAIWNLRARFLYRGGDSWADALHPLLVTSHLDYPWLLPLSVSRCWTYLGQESPMAPTLLALGFTLATVGLLVSGLSTLRGRTQGMLGGLVLLATPFLFESGSTQYADVPLAYFLLATTVMLALGDRVAVAPLRLRAAAGLLAGLSAWTKNEGVLFLIAVVVARLAVIVPTRGWRAYRSEAAGFALGLAPVLVVLILFKTQVSTPSDYVSGQGLARISVKLADPSRYAVIGRALAREVYGWGGGIVLGLVAYRVLLGKPPRPVAPPTGRFAVLVLILMLGAYVLAYVVTPHFLPWHLNWSLTRLLLHLWPLALFAFFLGVASPEEALTRARAAQKGIPQQPEVRT